MVSICYREEYNFVFSLPSSLLPHPFDPNKYDKVMKGIRDRISSTTIETLFITLRVSQPVSESDLLLVHSAEQLLRLSDKAYLSKSIDFPYLLHFVPFSSIDACLLAPMRWATAGTVQAALHAWDQREIQQRNSIGHLSINLGGGYHHAKYSNEQGDNGGCLYADIPLACEKLLTRNPRMRIAIVDLDIHQGNGLEEYAGRCNGSVNVFDMYNHNEYPWNNDNTLRHAHTAIPLDGGFLERSLSLFGKTFDASAYDFLCFTEHVVKRAVDDKEYLDLLRSKLPVFLDSVRPDFVFYNAGTDPYEHDPWGCTAVTRFGIIERDQFVYEQVCVQRQCPMVMTLSGGYAADSADLIAESIANIIRNQVKDHQSS